MCSPRDQQAQHEALNVPCAQDEHGAFTTTRAENALMEVWLQCYCYSTERTESNHGTSRRACESIQHLMRVTKIKPRVNEARCVFTHEQKPRAGVRARRYADRHTGRACDGVKRRAVLLRLRGGRGDAGARGALSAAASLAFVSKHV